MLKQCGLGVEWALHVMVDWPFLVSRIHQLIIDFKRSA